jgi:hypothetical protein
MSRSEPLIPLTASAQTAYSGLADPVEILLIDGHLRRIEQSVGRLKTKVPPGVYKLKFKAGSTIEEVPVYVTEDSGPINVDIPALLFSSPAPLDETKTTREYHREQSENLSRETHARLGTGAAIFVFVRDLDGRGRVSPAVGLSLSSLEGETLIDYGEVAKFGRGRTEDESNLWAGYTAEVTPGSYRLVCDTGEVGVVEQLVHASPGMQTHVFLTRRAFGDGRSGRRADLIDASIHMTELGMGFAPYGTSFRDAELARKALANRRPEAVPKDSLRRLLNAKFVNPMLGLYGAYLLTEMDEPSRKLLGIVRSNLRKLLGEEHPDLAALEVRMAHLGLRKRRPSSIDVPPMIRLGWDAIVKESADNHDLVAVDSLAGRVADRLWGRGPWLVWQQPHPPPDDYQPLEDDQIREVLTDIRAAGANMDEELISSVRLTPLESGILDLTKTIPGDRVDDPDLGTWAVQSLGVPPTVASQAVQSLHQKISKDDR